MRTTEGHEHKHAQVSHMNMGVDDARACTDGCVKLRGCFRAWLTFSPPAGNQKPEGRGKPESAEHEPQGPAPLQSGLLDTLLDTLLSGWTVVWWADE